MAKGILIMLFTLTLLLSIGSVYCTSETVANAKDQMSDAANYVKDTAKEIPGYAKNAYDDVTGDIKSTVKGSGKEEGSASWKNWFKGLVGGSSGSKAKNSHGAPSPAPVAA